MVDGRTWRKAKILPCKYAIAAYSAAIAGLPLQIAYGDWQRICHAMALPYNNTDYSITCYCVQ